MLKFTVHAGHAPENGKGQGAVGLMNESHEAREVVKGLMTLFARRNDMDVLDCTVNENMSAGDVLNKLNNHMNNFNGMFNLSIHLNSSATDMGNGCECWCHNDKSDSVSLATAICHKISEELVINNRGVRYNQKLSVLRNTKAPTIIIECCFVDNKYDFGQWNALKCARAIYDAILTFFDLFDVDIVDIPSNNDENSDDNRDVLYKVQLGAFSKKSNAEKLSIELERNGYKTYIKEEKK